MVESLTNEIICGSGPYWEWLEYLFTLYMYMYKHVHIPNRPMQYCTRQGFMWDFYGPYGHPYLSMIGFPRVRTIYINVCVTYASMRCIRN